MTNEMKGYIVRKLDARYKLFRQEGFQYVVESEDFSIAVDRWLYATWGSQYDYGRTQWGYRHHHNVQWRSGTKKVTTRSSLGTPTFKFIKQIFLKGEGELTMFLLMWSQKRA